MSTETSGHNAPPPLPAPSLRPLPPSGSESEDIIKLCRSFFGFAGGSVLYCLSAMSIIYGITQIMGPTLLRSGALSETLPCIAALNLYELALLGALAFIVLWHHVTDDAISLVILIPLFMVGSGIALDTVANNGPGLAIAIGFLCAVIGGGKLLVLHQAIRVPLGRLSLTGLTAVLFWNYLAGPTLVRLFTAGSSAVAAKRTLWLVSLLIVTAGSTLAWLEAVRGERNAGRNVNGTVPLLRTTAMVCILTLVLLGAAGAHLYSLGYMFDIRNSPGDYLLLLLFGCLLAMEALFRGDQTAQSTAPIVAGVPLIVAAYVLVTPTAHEPFTFGLEWLAHPCAMLAIGAAAMLWTARRLQWTTFRWLAAAYLLGAVLTWGWSPTAAPALNWRLTAALLIAGLLAAGLLLRKPALCVAAVMGATVGTGTLSAFARAMETIGLDVAGGMAGLGGIGLLAIAWVFAEKRLLPIVYLGALLLMGCAFDYLDNVPGWRDVIAMAGLLLAAGVVWWRFRALPPVFILAVPVVARLWLVFRTLSAWRYIVLSFVLLAVGAWLSVIKGRKSMGPVAQGETPDAP